MKKKLFRAFACVMALAAILTLSACGGGNESSGGKTSSVSSAAESSAPASSAAESSAAESAAGLPAGSKFATIADFVNSDAVQSQLDSLMEHAGEDMDVSITGEGDKLIYLFKFAQGTEGMAESPEAFLDARAPAFESIAASLKLAVEVENPIVVVTYADSEGTEICSREFTPAE